MSIYIFLLWSFVAQPKLLRSSQADQLTYSHFFQGMLSPVSSQSVLCAHTFATNRQLPFLNNGRERMFVEITF